MADANPNVGEFKAKADSDEQVNEAVGAYLDDPESDTHPITDGHVLDLAAAVGAHPWTSQVAASPESSKDLKPGAIRTAILLAPAQKM